MQLPFVVVALKQNQHSRVMSCIIIGAKVIVGHIFDWNIKPIKSMHTHSLKIHTESFLPKSVISLYKYDRSD